MSLVIRISFAVRHSPAGPKVLSKGRSFVIYFREWSVAFALFALLLVLAVLAPGFFQKSQLLSICSTAVPVLLVACGISLVIISRQIDISAGSQFAVCSVCAGLLAAMKWPLALVLPSSLVIGATLGAFNGALIAGLRLPSIVVTQRSLVRSPRAARRS